MPDTTRAYGRVWKIPGLTHMQKAVLRYLDDAGHKQPGVAQVGRDTLCKRTGLEPDTLRVVLDALRKGDWLTWEKPSGGGATIYRLNVPKIVAAAAETDAQERRERDNRR